MLGSGIAALSLAALLGRSDLLFVGLFLSIATLVAVMSVTIDRPRLRVTRTFNPDVIAVGESATVATHVRNESPRPSTSALWREAAPDAIEVQPLAPLPRLAAHQTSLRRTVDTVLLRQDVRGLHRGSHTIGPFIVSHSDPFGLARAEDAFGHARQLLVTPRVQSLPRRQLDIASSEGTEHELLRHSIPSADELIAREYRPGDALRRVHWRATARHDKLMVRQEEQRSDPEAWILFDTHVPPTHIHVTSAALVPAVAEAGGESGSHADFEGVVELVASLGVHLLDEGFVLRIVETTPRQLQGRVGAARSGAFGSATPTYDLAGADALLLADLAGVESSPEIREDAVAELASGLRRSGRAAPVFAVLQSGAFAEVGALVATRAMCEPAIAFLGADVEPAAAEALTDGGWTCVTFAHAADIQAAWQQALAQHRQAARHG